MKIAKQTIAQLCRGVGFDFWELSKSSFCLKPLEANYSETK
jgi:hypothetical protein